MDRRRRLGVGGVDEAVKGREPGVIDDPRALPTSVVAAAPHGPGAHRLRRARDGIVLAPELLLELLVQDRVRQLGAASVAEDAADERCDRDHILDRERLRRDPERRVLGRHHRQRTERILGGRDVRVDPGDVVGRVREDLLTVREVGLLVGDLRGEILLRVRLARPHALVHGDVLTAIRISLCHCINAYPCGLTEV